MAAKIVYDITIMRFMSLFETITRAKLKDCIMGDSLITFVVQPGEASKAIGKRAANIKKLEFKFKKKVKIVEFNETLEGFIKNLVFPAKVKDIQWDGKLVTIFSADLQSRGLIIGRDAKRLRSYESIAQRYFSALEEIKVK